MQSLLIGLGAVLSSALPWILTRLGAAGGTEPGNAIPRSIHLAFYAGAVAFLGCVLYTVITTPEHPGEISADDHPVSALRSILSGLTQMPRAMRRLALVQFFTWLGLFCMWLYFTPAVAARFFGAVGTAGYTRGVEWGGVCIATYNGVAFVVSFLLVALARHGVGSRVLHLTGLLCAAAGLMSVGLWADYHLLLVSMVGVGIGWAAILSMPYALLANSIPAQRMGFYMGVFNFFIVLPQIVAAAILGPVVNHLLDGRGLPVVIAGGGCFLVAALGLRWVPDADAPASLPEPANAAL
jgi:maltose/moltooligosaccharide transporter